MTYAEYYNAKWADVLSETADRTFGEEVWGASQRSAWEAVFQIVSDKHHLVPRGFIKELEAARGQAGCGP